MALVPCRECRQPFYASCHDGSCGGAVCPHCEYAELAMDDRPRAVDASPSAAVAGAVSDAAAHRVTSSDTGRAHLPGPPAHGGRG